MDYTSVFSIGEDEIIFEGKFLYVKRRPFTNLKKGKSGTWEVVERKGASGRVVGVLAITADKKAILAESFRIPLKQRVISCVMGGARKGESEEAAALRELEEETGYRAESLQILFTGPFNPAVTWEEIIFYLAYPAFFIGRQKLDIGEDIRLRKIPLDEDPRISLRKLAGSALIDVKTYGALYAAKSLLKI